MDVETSHSKHLDVTVMLDLKLVAHDGEEGKVIVYDGNAPPLSPSEISR